MQSYLGRILCVVVIRRMTIRNNAYSSVAILAFPFVTATPSFLAFSTISKRFLAPTAEATVRQQAKKEYQFQPHKFDYTLEACLHLAHFGPGRLCVLKVSNAVSFCYFRNQSAKLNDSFQVVPMASMAPL